VVAGFARERPGAPAFLTDDGPVTWAHYDGGADRAAAALKGAGLSAGDRVGILMPDGADVHQWYVGAERAGVVVVGIGPRAGDAEVAHLLARGGARVLVTGEEVAGRPAPDAVAALRAGGLALDAHLVAADAVGTAAPVTTAGPPIGPDDLFLLNSTSGTTGLPKCVMHHQRRWFYFHHLAVQAGALSGDDVFMSLLPTPFGFGLWTAHFTPAILGAPVVVTSRFRAADALRLVGRHRVTVLACVTTQFVMMLNDATLDDADLSSLRVMFTGGEAVPYRRALEFEERTGARVLQFYGSNETGALSRTTLADPPERRLRSAGRVIPDMHVRLLDGNEDVTATGGPGEPVCRGPATSLGYWDDPVANARLLTDDGWMRTGDLAELDTDGYLTIVGRLSDIIIRGGKNISAAQVEQEVGTHPDVAMVAAVAQPDPVFGERVCVFVVPVAGRAPSLDDMAAHLARRGVGKELWPEAVVVVGELPRSSGGKVAKGELRARLTGPGGASGSVGAGAGPGGGPDGGAGVDG
jgi:acyl-CoA synthetase